MKTSRIAFAALIPLVRNLDDLGRGSNTVSWKHCQGGSSQLNLPDNKYSIRSVKRSSRNQRLTLPTSTNNKDKIRPYLLFIANPLDAG
ncbi:hypothetical protein Tco_0812814 [Tanacetum coccineum]